MESGLPIRESRWHRPRLYLTIVGLFLLIFPFIPLSYVVILTGIMLFGGGGIMALFVAFEFAPAFFMLLAVTILSVSAATKLLRQEEKSFTISFISLTIWSVLSCLFAFGFTLLQFGNRTAPIEWGLTCLVFIGVMFFFLIKGRRKSVK
ncbi:MAG: hypothetical protein ACREBI_04990 [Nitrosotalea sp.]